MTDEAQAPLALTADIDTLTVRMAAGDLAAEHVLLFRAARGDLSAQRLLRDEGERIAVERGDDHVFVIAEAMGRLAASHGFPSDRLKLAALYRDQATRLRARGCGEPARFYETEALIELNLLADAGMDRAAELLSALAAECSREAVTAAAQYREPDIDRAAVAFETKEGGPNEGREGK